MFLSSIAVYMVVHVGMIVIVVLMMDAVRDRYKK